MPTTYRECLSRISMLLGEPHPNYPSEPVIWRYLADAAQLLFQQAMNSPPAWSVQYEDITVQPNQDLYQLAAGNFGKDVLVETIDLTDPNHVSAPVRRMSLQSALLGGNSEYVQQSYYPMAGLKHTVQTMIFYREGSSVNIRILPKNVPQSADYRIWYYSAEVNTDTESNTFALPQGVPYLCAYTAGLLLPLTRWCGFTEEQNSARRKEFGATLPRLVQDHEREWRKFLATDRKPGLTVMRGFDDESYQVESPVY